MTDRYTELVKQAYEAQQAREGERYQSLTSDLARIDADLEALAAKREDAVSVLESMDDAIEAAKEALDAYFAGREEGDEGLFEATPAGALDAEAEAYLNPYRPEWAQVPLSEGSEFESAKANGALTD